MFIMKETITLSIDIKRIETILLDYYKKYFKDNNIELKYKVVDSSDYYGYDDVNVSILRKIKVGEFEATSENVLTKDEISFVLNELLEKYKYKILFVNYIIKDKWSGVKVNVEKVKVKELKKNLKGD